MSRIHNDISEPLDDPVAVVVIGGSAGTIAALRLTPNQLPLGFPAAILVVVHWPPHTSSALRLLGGRLPVALATDGAPLRSGCMTLARPDRHLLVDAGQLRLSQTYEEHHFRPAIDPLFRSAARAYGPRVVGVLLSGRDADGTAGLLNVVLHGGVAVVQDPDEAEHTTMSQSALDNVPGARCLRMANIAAALVEFTAAAWSSGLYRSPHEAEGLSHADGLKAAHHNLAHGGPGTTATSGVSSRT